MNKKLFLYFFCGLLTFFCFFQPAVISAAIAWPAGTGTDISSELVTTFGADNEPSGLIWHAGRSSLFMVLDSGYLVELNASGHILNQFNGSSIDFEGITISDADSDKLYLAEENPEQKVYEFSISSWSLTGKTWLLSGMVVSSNYGLESLAYAGNNFYAGSQLNGIIYIYPVDLNTSATLNYSGTIETNTLDLSDLNFQGDQNILYAIYDGSNLLREYTLDGVLLNEFDLPSEGNTQEGVALLPNYPENNTTIYIAEDSGGLKEYANYPIDLNRYDFDNDDYNYSVDCNDNDASINASQTFYIDADIDGYGSALTGSICSSTPPVGYSINNSDCNDADVLVHENIVYYLDNDNDGLGDPNNFIAVCSSIAPSGYVNNANDIEQPPIEEFNVYLNNKYLFINDLRIKIFQNKPKKSKVKYYNYYSDEKTEIIILALMKAKKAKIVSVSYTDQNNYKIKQRETQFFKYKKNKIRLKIQDKRNQFQTTFNNKYYQWKIKKSAKFSKK